MERRTPWLGRLLVMLVLALGSSAQAETPPPLPAHAPMERRAVPEQATMMPYMQDMLMQREQGPEVNDEVRARGHSRIEVAAKGRAAAKDEDDEDDEDDEADVTPDAHRRHHRRPGADRGALWRAHSASLQQMRDLFMLQQMQSLLQQQEEHKKKMGHGGMLGHGRMLGHGKKMGHAAMLGHGGIQHHVAMLTQHLRLSAEQQQQVQQVLQPHAKDMVRLQAAISTLELDLQPLLETNPVDLAAVKQQLESIAGHEAALRLSHITAIQQVRVLLTPEQQQQFQLLRRSWRQEGRMSGHGGQPQ